MPPQEERKAAEEQLKEEEQQEKRRRFEVSPQVLSKNPALLADKIAALTAAGNDHVQVIADFDFTLTAFYVGGRRGCSCHGVIEECGLLSEEYHTKAVALKNHYYPLEVDHSLSHDERVRFMEEWVGKAHDLILEHGLTKRKIQQAVQHANIRLREGHAELFAHLEAQAIPLLIFSAGLADVLSEVLAQHSDTPPPSTTHVISNKMRFFANGDVEAFVGTLFHVFNKHALGVQEEPYFQSDEVKRRANILLLGDSLGDPNMVEGLEAKQVLSVGFLNDKVEERMDKYLEAYDVVLLGDPSLDYVVQLLKQVK